MTGILDRKAIHDAMRDLLSVFSSECDRLGIRYFATGGTLLGAVRDGGPIAWDDDIDVGMTRHDYLVLTDNAVFPERYEFINDKTPWHLGKILDSYVARADKVDRHFGMFVSLTPTVRMAMDIFPYDYVPDDSASCSAFLNYLRSLYYKPGREEEYFKILSSVGKTSRVTSTGFTPDLDNLRLFPSDGIEGDEPLPKLDFLGLELPVPRHPENWIKARYGSSWTLPLMGQGIHVGSVAVYQLRR